MKTFKDVYQMPLVFDYMDGWNSWVYDSKGNFVFQWEFDVMQNKDFVDNVMGAFNGTYKPQTQGMFYHENGQIFIKTQVPHRHIITIRGWGNLTGVGGMNLPQDEAANIQDTFAEHLVSILNNENNEKVQEQKVHS